ncbi:MAG: acyl-CoA dehydrogenase [Flavobacteriales bacterium]|nr:acyl-CoA dehydrogenase [Flavobacteriales bacterium]
MAKEYMSMRNLRFQLHEVLNVEQLTKYERYAEHTKDGFDMMLDSAKQISDNLLFPIYTEMDEKKPEMVDGVVRVHPDMKKIMKEVGESGWIVAQEDFHHGGQQMPAAVYNAANFIFHSANTSAASYFGLTMGSAELISTFGSKELQETYMTKMFAGEWQGTMALTEPHAGSSLGDIYTTATEIGDGSYKIKGQKIFISAGDHDGVENVVHLMLAKIDGGPAGSKGISLFVVPKLRPENGALVPNDVFTAGFEAKMGMKGCPVMHLVMGDNDNCKGWLVGEPHNGLRYMFQMMNGARISVGMMSSALSSAAYYASLEYANERPQGRTVSNQDVTSPMEMIINYADVKRMLLFQKSVMEGSLALVCQCAMYADLAKVSEGEEATKYKMLLDLLTPMAKAYPSEISVQSTSQGMQVLGGAGFCSDFPLQQYYRDTRINPIYEGTTGIQAMDLLGRKVTMKMGAAVMAFGQELQETIMAGMAVEALQPYATKLGGSAQKFQEVTMKLMGLAQSEKPEVFLADATLYLENAGILAVAWQWLKQALVIEAKLAENPTGDELNFYKGKQAAFEYYFEYELPKSIGLTKRLLSDYRLTLNLNTEYLN